MSKSFTPNETIVSTQFTSHPTGQDVAMFYTHQPTNIPGVVHQNTTFDARPASPKENRTHGNLVDSKATITTSPFGLVVVATDKAGVQVRCVVPYAGIKMFLLK